MESSIFEFLRAVLLPTPDAGRGALEVAMRFQQYTAPVQAKGVEDTAFYRHFVLASLNEVGGDPGRIGLTVEEFHRALRQRHARQPFGMVSTATHDTKRGEDTRARITALSELPDAWGGLVTRWRRLHAVHRTRLAGGQAPDPNDEYLFYQTLIGVWPEGAREASDDLVARVAAYMHKAIKEAKLHTSWITPNTEYESATARFVERALTGRTAPEFFATFVPFASRVATAGMANALAQLVLKLAAPGVADVYQGTETWDLSLVDPDNRRPVDFAHRRRLLEAVEPWLPVAADGGWRARSAGAVEAVREWRAAWPDGRLKLFLTALGLRLRRAHRDLFLGGSYEPLAAAGPAQAHVIAFARTHGPRTLVAVAPRLTVSLGASWPGGDSLAWHDTTLTVPPPLASASLTNLVSGETLPPGAAVPLRDVLAACPVALLWADRDGH
jgi:(1->4)-alpha-D-glucan 1-alpha-D-glucosylmutase